MPKAKPISLSPLSFEEALQALMKVTPEKILNKAKKKSQKRK
jgi:hypothetical protein